MIRFNSFFLWKPKNQHCLRRFFSLFLLTISIFFFLQWLETSAFKDDKKKQSGNINDCLNEESVKKKKSVPHERIHWSHSLVDRARKANTITKLDVEFVIFSILLLFYMAYLPFSYLYMGSNSYFIYLLDWVSSRKCKIQASEKYCFFIVLHICIRPKREEI